MMMAFSKLSLLTAIGFCSLATSSIAQAPQTSSRFFSCSVRSYDWQNPSKGLFGEPVEIAVLLDTDVPTSGVTIGSTKGTPAVLSSKLRIYDPAHILWPASESPIRIAYEGAGKTPFSVFAESATGLSSWLRIYDAPAAADGASLDADLILMRKGVKPITAAVSKMGGTCEMETGADTSMKFEALK